MAKKKVAIVGGGIAGLYCAWVLSRREHEVHLFESSNRLGGRIRSIRLDKDNRELGSGLEDDKRTPWTEENLNFYVEFGPMRLELDKQLLLRSLLDELGIVEPKTGEVPKAVKAEGERGPSRPYLVDFPAYSSPSSSHDPHYDLKPDEEGKTPLQLMKLAFLRTLIRLTVPEEVPVPGKVEPDARLFPKFQLELIQRIQLAAAVSEPIEKVFMSWLKDLPPQALWEIQTLAWLRERSALSGTVVPGEEPAAEEPKGVPLYMLGFWNLLSDHLSHDALNKLKDLGTFYHLLPENPNAAEWLVWWLVGLSADDRMQGIHGGMECIVDQLRLQLKDVDIRLGCRVTGLCKTASGRVRLKFDTDTLPADTSNLLVQKDYDHVILALPRRALQAVQRESDVFAGEAEIQDLLESSFSFPLVKSFVVLKKRWWEEDRVMTNRFATRMPTRELHFWKGHLEESEHGLIMAYTDRPASSFWANYLQSGAQTDAYRGHGPSAGGDAPGSASPEEVVPLTGSMEDLFLKKMAHYISENNKPDGIKPRDILWYGIRDWGRAPFSGAAHLWRPERKYWVVMRRLAETEVLDSHGEAVGSVHVCGEAYSDYHGFIEGSLRSAVYVLHRILDRPDSGDKKESDSLLSWLTISKTKGPDELMTVGAQYLESLKSWARNLDSIGKTEPFLDMEKTRADSVI